MKIEPAVASASTSDDQGAECANLETPNAETRGAKLEEEAQAAITP